MSTLLAALPAIVPALLMLLKGIWGTSNLLEVHTYEVEGTPAGPKVCAAIQRLGGNAD